MSKCPFKKIFKHPEKCDWDELHYCNIAESFGDCPFEKKEKESDEFSHLGDCKKSKSKEYLF
jgi:hypothetical protein